MQQRSKRDSRRPSRRQTIASIATNLRRRSSISEEHQQSRGSRESIAAFLWESAGEAFQQALPFKFLQRSDRELVGIVGASFYFIIIGTFCSLFAYSYLSYTNSPYISARYESSHCDKVGATITGTFVGGYDGVWRLESDPLNNQGLYKLQLDNFQVDDEAEFGAFIAGLEEDYIAPLGVKMANNSLISNLLHLMTFRADVMHRGRKQVLTFSAAPSAVFNMFRYQLQLSARNATCGYSGAATGSKGKFLFEYSYANYLHQYTDYDRFHDFNSSAHKANSYNYSTCHSIAPVTDDIIAHRLDMEAMTTAVAINLGIMNDSFLNPIDEEYRKLYSTVSYRGVTYYWFYTFNLRFPDAPVMKCLRRLSGDDSSFVRSFETYCLVDFAGTFYGIPVLDSYGMRDMANSRYDRCTCPSARYSPHDYSYECQQFDFQGGVIFFPKASSSKEEWASLLDVITGYSPDQLQERGYALTRHAFYKYWKERADFSFQSSSSSSYYRYTNGYSLEETDAFAFCNNSCAISAFNIYRNFNMYSSGRMISSSLYSLFNVSTTCSAFIQSSSFSGLFSPPVPLTESYYSCTPTTLESLLFAMGAAQGTLQSLTLPALLLVVAPAVYALMYLMSSLPQKQPFSEQERQSVLGLLSEVVLEERDGLDNGIAEGSVLRALASELLARAAKLSDAAERSAQPAAPVLLYGLAEAGAATVELELARRDDSDSDEGSEVHDWTSRGSGDGL